MRWLLVVGLAEEVVAFWLAHGWRQRGLSGGTTTSASLPPRRLLACSTDHGNEKRRRDRGKRPFRQPHNSFPGPPPLFFCVSFLGRRGEKAACLLLGWFPWDRPAVVAPRGGKGKKILSHSTGEERHLSGIGGGGCLVQARPCQPARGRY